MFRTNTFLKALFSLAAFLSISFQGIVVTATDIVGTEDVVSGASVFVFRESRKKPQESGAARSASAERGSGRIAIR